jgi:hypothetical protein
LKQKLNICLTKIYTMLKKPRVKNQPLTDLILQCLDEPAIRIGSYSTFARLFTQYSGIPVDRAVVCIWVNGKGVPKKRCAIAAKLSKKYVKAAHFKTELITVTQLRPDLFATPTHTGKSIEHTN